MKYSRLFFQLALLSILGVAVLGSTIRIVRMSDEYKLFEPLIEVKHLITTRAYEKPDDQDLQFAAIAGVVEAVNDPYTVYIPPSDSGDFEKDLIGEYVGIGAQVTLQEGYLMIVTPLDGSPALKAGILAGDTIVEIDGTSTLGKSIDDCIDLLMGEPGVPVHVTVERDGERLPVTIIRDHINTVQVKGIHRRGENDWQFMLDPERRIGYVWLTQFTPGCAAEIRDTLESLGATEGNLHGLIFDLRWNPGGVLAEAVALADMFLDKGVIVSTRSREGDEDIDRATSQGTLPDFPMVILLNEFSASASEVFSGALVDHGRAKVLGTRSVGKGSVQSVFSLSSAPGAKLKITDRRYYLPSGRSIQRTDDAAKWGVDPSPGMFVPLTDEEVREVIRLRQEEDIIRPDTKAQEAGAKPYADPDWVESTMRDVQLAAAIRTMDAKLDTGEWTSPGSDQPVADLAIGAELKRLAEARERIYLELERMQRRIEAIESNSTLLSDETLPDLWPDERSVAGGVLEIRDAQGNVVAKLDIPSDNLERWLIGAGLEKNK